MKVWFLISLCFISYLFFLFPPQVSCSLSDSHLSFRPSVCCEWYDPAWCSTRERHYGSEEFSFIVNWLVNCKFNRIGEPLSALLSSCLLLWCQTIYLKSQQFQFQSFPQTSIPRMRPEGSELLELTENDENIGIIKSFDLFWYFAETAHAVYKKYFV